MIVVTVPIKTVAGLNAREHWRTRQRRVKHERESVAWALTCTQLPPLPVTVLMTRLSPGTLDSDNLQGACKAVRDAVADALKVPDNHPLIEWRYGQEKCPRGQYGIRITVEQSAALVTT